MSGSLPLQIYLLGDSFWCEQLYFHNLLLITGIDEGREELLLHSSSRVTITTLPAILQMVLRVL